MNFLLLMVMAMTLIYACRWVGFVLTDIELSLFGEHFLRRVPAALFTALIISALYQESDWLSVKLCALAVAGGVVWHTRQVGWSVVAGLTILWILMFGSRNW